MDKAPRAFHPGIGSVALAGIVLLAVFQIYVIRREPPGATRRPNPAGIDWVSIPGGSFIMGSDSGNPDEKPRHGVVVRTFQMARTPVTWGQYKKCMRAGACSPPDPASYCNSHGNEHPVVCVDWEQARRFARWSGGRLPSEAEWEYAARSAGRERRYPWGDEEATCHRTVFIPAGEEYGCGKKSTWPVCSKPAGNTAQGLCDMAGEVWEWTQDWYRASYAGARGDGGFQGFPQSPNKVIRGGSWYSVAWYVRASNRGRVKPNFRHFYLGLRPVRSS